MEKRVRCNQEGLAMIEAALCLVVLLPVALAATALATLIHDLAVVRTCVERMIHEQKRPVMTWQQQGSAGSLRVNDTDLRATIKTLAVQAVSKVSSEVIGMKNLSALCCYIVYQVDTVSGALKGERYRVCDAQGSIATRLSVDAPLQERVDTARGIAVTAHAASQGYFESVVFVGLVIGGEYSGIAPLLSNEVISSGVVELPNREVSL